MISQSLWPKLWYPVFHFQNYKTTLLRRPNFLIFPSPSSSLDTFLSPFYPNSSKRMAFSNSLSIVLSSATSTQALCHSPLTLHGVVCTSSHQHPNLSQRWHTRGRSDRQSLPPPADYFDKRWTISLTLSRRTLSPSVLTKSVSPKMQKLPVGNISCIFTDFAISAAFGLQNLNTTDFLICLNNSVQWKQKNGGGNKWC